MQGWYPREGGSPIGSRGPRVSTQGWGDGGGGGLGGSGLRGGAFTLALADLLGGSAKIFSVDTDSSALRHQGREMAARFPGASVHYLRQDFTRSLDLPPLDGVLMANSLHFVRGKIPLLEMVRGYLRPGGRFILVEYNSDRGNPWVPHPISYSTWESLAEIAGFPSTRVIGRVPSRFLGEIYSALSLQSPPKERGRELPHTPGPRKL